MRAVACAFLAALVSSPGIAARLLEARTSDGAVEVSLVAADLESGRDALALALEEIRQVQDLADGRYGGVARVNREASGGPVPVDPRLLALLARAASFCHWSEGAHGPLGGWLNEAWSVRGNPRGRPAATRLEEGAALARCDGLRLDPEAGTVRLEPGRRIDLWGFATGYAVDRAIEVLAEAGEANARVRVGRVQRGVGAGPDGEGWPVTLAVGDALRPHMTGLRLRDDALAIADDEPLEIGGDRVSRYLDQRTGRPAEGIAAVAVISELAVDARGLAVGLAILGPRVGGHRAGLLHPAPAVLWLLGDGDGEPLALDARWSAGRRPRAASP